jgi:hypothetical protein
LSIAGINLFILFCPAPKSKPAAPVLAEAQRPLIAAAYGKLPIRFEANEGQTDRK